MKNSGLIILAAALIGASVYLMYRQQSESQKYYKKTGESFAYKYGGDIIGLLNNLISRKKGE